ncbi:hypothetical protein VFPBJ_11474 [Purpureocillium lilacinum]|uniref:Uncharacterized protein n=1 Tax=Purpureocillium lilacinum TaxID=33203 RepID=A0A179F7E1_PURLI|nr:hypothetical protein VFPBJ_11474 [Purpureocillium lilacinum]
MMYLVRFSNYQSHLRSASVTLAVLRPVPIQLECRGVCLCEKLLTGYMRDGNAPMPKKIREPSPPFEIGPSAVAATLRELDQSTWQVLSGHTQ